MRRLRAMAMGMAVMMGVVVGVIVRMGVSHAKMLYYNITGVQKAEGV
jgi:hypothetical protein